MSYIQFIRPDTRVGVAISQSAILASPTLIITEEDRGFRLTGEEIRAAGATERGVLIPWANVASAG